METIYRATLKVQKRSHEMRPEGLCGALQITSMKNPSNVKGAQKANISHSPCSLDLVLSILSIRNLITGQGPNYLGRKSYQAKKSTKAVNKFCCSPKACLRESRNKGIQWDTLLGDHCVPKREELLRTKSKVFCDALKRLSISCKSVFMPL